MWQDYLDKEFMLMSMRNHRYIGKSPTTGSPYSMDYTGADPARRNGVRRNFVGRCVSAVAIWPGAILF